MVRLYKKAIERLTILSLCLLVAIACDQPPLSPTGDFTDPTGHTEEPQDTLLAEIEDLGTLNGRTFHEARAVNRMGQITGISKTMEPPVLHSFFLWNEQAGLTDLGRFEGSTSGTVTPHAINSDGEIAGENYPYAVRWSPSEGFLSLGEGVAFGLNDHGTTVGYQSRDFHPELLPHEGTQAVLWNRDGDQVILETFSEMLDRPVERDWNQAHDINNRGETVGFSVYPSGSGQISGPRRALVWEEGRIVHDLGTLGGESSEAFAINDEGQVVGQSDFDGVSADMQYVFSWDQAEGLVLRTERIDRDRIGSAAKTDKSGDGGSPAFHLSSTGDPDHSFEKVTMANQSRAFIWDEVNGMVNLGTVEDGPSVATDINSQGQVVGYILIPASDTHSNRARAFYWDETHGMVLLEPLDESYDFSFAYGINDDGIVVGRSSSGQPGDMRAVRWKITFEEKGAVAQLVAAE